MALVADAAHDQRPAAREVPGTRDDGHRSERRQTNRLSRSSASHASPTARRITSAAAPVTRNTLHSDRTPSGTRRAGRRRNPLDATRKPQRPGRPLADERQSADGVVVPGHDDDLQQIAERGFDRALGAGIDVEVIGDRSVMRESGCRHSTEGAAPLRRTRHASLRAPRATAAGPHCRPGPARACGRRARATRARCAPSRAPIPRPGAPRQRTRDAAARRAGRHGPMQCARRSAARSRCADRRLRRRAARAHRRCDSAPRRPVR